MNCLKCGAETQDRQVFCPHCQEVMQRYPVKADTPVSLPIRRREPVKKPAPRQAKPEEQVVKLKQKLLVQAIFIVALVLALGISLFGLYFLSTHGDDPKGPAIGQNYSSSTTIAPRVLDQDS